MLRSLNLFKANCSITRFQIGMIGFICMLNNKRIIVSMQDRKYFGYNTNICPKKIIPSGRTHYPLLVMDYDDLRQEKITREVSTNIESTLTLSLAIRATTKFSEGAVVTE